MIKEKKEEGEEGAPAKAGEKGAEKAAAKAGDKAAAAGDKKAAPAGDKKGPRPRRRNNLVGSSALALPPQGGRAWRTFISSWVWEIRARNTRERATMSGFCWSRNWRSAGRRLGTGKEVQRSPSPGRIGMVAAGAAVRAADVHEFERRGGPGGWRRFTMWRPGRFWWWWTTRICRLGQFRLRPSGSSGGHHGLESIEQHLGTREFARLRIGIGRQDGAREITDYVLGRFDSTEARLGG